METVIGIACCLIGAFFVMASVDSHGTHFVWGILGGMIAVIGTVIIFTSGGNKTPQAQVASQCEQKAVTPEPCTYRSVDGLHVYRCPSVTVYVCKEKVK